MLQVKCRNTTTLIFIPKLYYATNFELEIAALEHFALIETGTPYLHFAALAQEQQ
jgi:hypothetical protein